MLGVLLFLDAAINDARKALMRQSRFKWKAPSLSPSSPDFWGLERIPYANPTGFFNETSGKIC